MVHNFIVRMKIICIVLTGGPCGGKSTSLKVLTSALEEKGYRVMTVPEVPTILMSNGAHFPGRLLTHAVACMLFLFVHWIAAWALHAIWSCFFMIRFVDC